MKARPTGQTRRELLVRGMSLASLAVLGCNRGTEPVPVSVAPTRSSVPLRVLVVGEGASVETLQRAWSAADDGELQIETLAIARAEAGRLKDEVLARAAKKDVMVYPLLLGGDLFAQNMLVPFDLESLNVPSQADADETTSQLPPAVRTGLARFADQTIGLPLGGLLPAVFSVDSIEPLATWPDYDRLVSETWNGEAAEPSSPGWAAAMFLWRSISAAREGWLFERETMEPLIATEPYIEALAQMSQTHGRYKSKRISPDAIWTQLQQGTLRGGITFPTGSVDAFPDIQVSSLPGGESIQRVLFDPFTPIASISTACRQSSFAKQFIAWLATADGTSALGQCITGVKQVIEPTQSGVEVTVNDSPYDRWLDDVWKTPLTNPALQIANGGAYYEALDAEVGKVLDKKSKPAEALQVVAERWRKLTEEVGEDVQLRVWNQAQGRRG